MGVDNAWIRKHTLRCPECGSQSAIVHKDRTKRFVFQQIIKAPMRSSRSKHKSMKKVDMNIMNCEVSKTGEDYKIVEPDSSDSGSD